MIALYAVWYEFVKMHRTRKMTPAAGTQSRDRTRSIATWKHRARALKAELYALYLACRDPRVPWYAKAVAACVVAYAFSPIDLIPDFVPILGYVDDLVLVPLGVLAVRWMIPPVVLAECRQRTAGIAVPGKAVSWAGAAAIVVVWLIGLACLTAWWLRQSN